MIFQFTLTLMFLDKSRIQLMDYFSQYNITQDHENKNENSTVSLIDNWAKLLCVRSAFVFDDDATLTLKCVLGLLNKNMRKETCAMYLSSVNKRLKIKHTSKTFSQSPRVILPNGTNLHHSTKLGFWLNINGTFL